MNKSVERLSTGITGLDEILQGGLIPGNAYLVRGGPGTGKTTLGLHFLHASSNKEGKCLFISLMEPESKLRKNAESIGFDLENINFLDLSPSHEFFAEENAYDIFPASEVEQKPMMEKILEEIQRSKPEKIFFDSISQLQYLSSDTFQFRKQMLSFLRLAVGIGSTVVFTSEVNDETYDDLQFISDGVINLGFIPEGRYISITKFRGSDFYSGHHSISLSNNGVTVFPKLNPESHGRQFSTQSISFGIPELDELLHGGLERGTVTVISGPSGVGKTSLGVQFLKEAAGRGERSIIYTFEESIDTLSHRCENINIPVINMMENDTLNIVKIDPLKYTPDEFAYLIREEVEKQNASIIMLDSISGYRLSFSSEENEMLRHLHTLSEYLTNMGVTVLLTNEVANITGDFKISEHGISYMADNIIFLRYLEMEGAINKAIGVLKKRTSDFEKNLREIEITSFGIKVGKPLTNLRGILSGSPEFINKEDG